MIRFVVSITDDLICIPFGRRGGDKGELLME